MKVESITLDGQNVCLEPLSTAPFKQLCEIGLDDELWRWIPSQIRSKADLEAYMEAALENEKQGSMRSFATIEKHSGRAVGSTRYGNIDLTNRRLEIGWTWIALPWQRTAVNTEAKYLMLRHAFETLRCIRVEFKTDALNERSRRAILRIGAVEEGTLRRQVITASGRVRDTVYYSIIDSEWSQIKANLEAKLRV